MIVGYGITIVLFCDFNENLSKKTHEIFLVDLYGSSFAKRGTGANQFKSAS